MEHRVRGSQPLVLRVGERKSLISTLVFSFNENRAFTPIIKVRGRETAQRSRRPRTSTRR
jgi:hypothetical protein